MTSKPCRGFTLVELAIVLVIVTLLAGGMMMSLSSQMDQRARTETEQKLQEIREALIGYAASHIAADGKPYLPCPDMDNDGFENRAGNVCSNSADYLGTILASPAKTHGEIVSGIGLSRLSPETTSDLPLIRQEIFVSAISPHAAQRLPPTPLQSLFLTGRTDSVQLT